MPSSLETSEIVRLLQVYEQLTKEGQDCGPTVAILARETRFPNLEPFLRSELLEKHRDVRDVAERLISDPPDPPRTSGMIVVVRTFLFAIVGAVVGLGGLALVGFIWGGVTRVGFWGEKAADFFSGGLLGVMLMIWEYGLPVGVASGVIGAILGAIMAQRR